MSKKKTLVVGLVFAVVALLTVVGVVVTKFSRRSGTVETSVRTTEQAVDMVPDGFTNKCVRSYYYDLHEQVTLCMNMPGTWQQQVLGYEDNIQFKSTEDSTVGLSIQRFHEKNKSVTEKDFETFLDEDLKENEAQSQIFEKRSFDRKGFVRAYYIKTLFQSAGISRYLTMAYYLDQPHSTIWRVMIFTKDKGDQDSVAMPMVRSFAIK